MTKKGKKTMNRLQTLSEQGQSVWIDFLSRDLARHRRARADDEGRRRRRRDVQPDDLPEGDRPGRRLRRAAEGARAARSDDPKEIFLELSARDVADACDLLRPVYDATGGVDGYVSWEVDPTFAYDRERTYDEAQRLHAWIDRPNLYVKIPATKPGLGAIEDMIAAGKNINVTLIFSLQRYAEVVEAYMRGLERLVAVGRRPGAGRVGRELLRLPRRHRGRPAARRDRLEGRARAARQARRREREARLPALPRGLLGRALGVPRGQGRPAAALPLGLDLDEEPGLPRRDVRRGADRPGHGRHDAARDDRGVPGPRRGRADARRRGSRRRARSSRTWPRSAWTSTTSPRRSRPRACRSSPTRSPTLLAEVGGKHTALAA